MENKELLHKFLLPIQKSFIADSSVCNCNCVLPTPEEIEVMYPREDVIKITDQRDIDEFKRRIDKKTCQPLKDELYSINSSFDGVYSDPWNR